ncbi:MAG: adenosine deaminase, partial [Erysipelotrichaceae bacterium]|nr:adenosine deaminase [Erysipelotrichaceae bacterium]
IVPEVGWKIAQDPEVDLNIKSFEEYLQLTTVPPLCTDVFEYLAKFGPIVKLMQKAQHIEEITYTSLQRAHQQNLWYLEIRFAPQKHTEKGLTQKEAVEAVLKGVRRAASDFPSLKVGVILCCMIEFFDNHEANMETVELCRQYLGKGVVGIDLAGGEDTVPMENYANLFVKAREYGIPMSIHAGDNGKPANVAMAIDWGARRIGHGKKCWYDKAVMNKVIAAGTPIEVCLTSNFQCRTEDSYESHPGKKLLDAGVKVTLNTDNMSISQIDLEYEYDKALELVGFTYNDLIQMQINAIEGAFMPEEEKQPYIDKLRTYFR